MTRIPHSFFPGRAKSFETTVKVKFKPDDSFKQAAQHIARFADPEVVGRVLRQAMSETILVAIKRRFLEGLPGAVNMKREATGKNVANAKLSRAIRGDLLTAYDDLNKAREGGNARAIAKAQTQVNKARKAVRSALERKRHSKNRLPHGEFRNLAMDVLELMTDPSEIKIIPLENGGVTVEIGNIPELEKIKTPSATEELTGSPTSSTKDILWRQLEFGTGAWADKQYSSPYRLASGGWWYGKSPTDSLLLRGTKPIGALKALHDPQALKFQDVFAKLLAAALSA